MRGVVSFAVRRRVTVSMAALAVVAFGIVGYERLPLDLLPDISYPSLTVQTEFPDTAPAEVENLVTRPIEETVGVLKGLRAIHSVSRAGLSEVTLEFDWGSDMEMLSMDVRERLDRLILPEESEDPVVLRFDPSLDPVMRLAMSSPGDLSETRRLADRRVKQDLETIPGVASAHVRGGLEEEIVIEIDQERLAALVIPIAEVRRVIASSNVNLPGGSLQDEESQYLIRTVNEFDAVDEIADLIIRQEAGGVVRLKDVARVARGAKDREEISRVNGRESVEIDLFREGNANTVTTARLVRERLAEIEGKLPPGSEITLLFDQSRFIEQAVGEVRSSALIGGILAVLILLLFLREARATLIIATSIPLSIVATFVAMYRFNVSLNIMSLGGLTLGIGMLVDNSIVVLESIFRRRQEGCGRIQAVVEGTSEVGGAVFASTLTTVAVFLPIVFVEGIAGQIFGDMALTVTLSLLASLVVAVTVIPMLYSLGKREPGRRSGAGEQPKARSLGRFSIAYDRLIRGALTRPRLAVSLAAGALIATVAATPLLQSSLIPEIREGEFYYEVQMPEGTALAATDRVLQEMERIASGDLAVERTYATVGSRSATGGITTNTKGEHLGQLHVVMRDRSDEAGEEALALRLRDRFAAIPDLAAKHGRPSYFTFKTPIEMVFYGEDLDRLTEHAGTIAESAAGVRGLTDIRSSLEAGSPEIRVHFDRARLASLGLDMREMSETLRDRLKGAVPTRYKEEDRSIDVRVRNRLADRRDIDDVRNFVLPGPGGRPIRLLSVADVDVARGPAEIHRVHQQRAAIVTANLQERSLSSAVREIRALFAANPPPPGVTAELAGQAEEMSISFKSLQFALLLAVFLVYLVMAATFESLLHPFIVLFSIPLALIGIVPGLVITGTQVSVIVLIGAVMLAGIVVNNAIVLIDRVNQNRRGGMAKQDAVIEACHTRLRPILMTTLTTVLGLLPMALAVGQGAELRAPLAITVSFGLAFSTFLTLAVIPAIYMLVPSRIAPEAPLEARR